ncbi:DNA-binding response regulator [Mycolicibacterium sp. P1-5]|nr:DNA-binding response regulator [Mycolicibacterium sp. P1-5]
MWLSAWHSRWVPSPNVAPALLVVEDDRALSAMLTTLFTEEGYRVDTAFDGQQGLHRGLTGGYDALIVDRGLPVMDGSELIALLRSKGVTTPALILTARGAVDDRVEGLDAGAQDYLVKPFEIPELLARVRALLRRLDNSATVIAAGGLRLDRVTRRVAGASDDDVELSEREASLLATLMAAPKRVFSRAQLLDVVFEGAESGGAVDLYVHYLRRKLGKQVIRTMHGTGYRFGLE